MNSSITGDRNLNRLMMSVSGRPAGSDIETLSTAVKVEVAKLKPGYVASVDLRGLNVLDQEAAMGISAIQKTLMSAAPAKVGTIVDGAIVTLQLSSQGRQADSNKVTQRFTDERAWHEYLGF